MSVMKVDLDNRAIDVSAEVNFIWEIANKLRGTYQSDKYKDVIIPMVIIRRLECALEKTKAAVVAEYESDPNTPAFVLKKIAGQQFYNTSKHNLAEIIGDPNNMQQSFSDYLDAFSEEAHSIIENLDFYKQIDKMAKADRLYSVVEAFSTLDLHPETVNSIKMGYIFEDLIRRFSEKAEAGDHYTSRDTINLMVDLVMAEGCDDILLPGKVVTILDQAAGTGGMLSVAHDYIKAMNPEADIHLFSQEINPESYAICMAEMIIRGQDIKNIKKMDTFKKDCFEGQQMRFVLENPPFGTPWGGKNAATGTESAVKAEAAKGKMGRFPAGTPSTGDAQLLFFQSALDKLQEQGRAVLVSNGSPLFSGNTSSGESQIRRWMIENDYIEAIVHAGTDMFYNTGISTYLWVLSKNKSEKRRGKIQLIDASGITHALRKPIGNKRNEFTKEDRAKITELYANFEETEVSKILDNEDFLYRDYTIMQPLQRNYSLSKERIDDMFDSEKMHNFFDEDELAELEADERDDDMNDKKRKRLKALRDNKPVYESLHRIMYANVDPNGIIYKSIKEFDKVVNPILSGFDNTVKKMVKQCVSVMDKTAEIQMKTKTKIEYDSDTKDSEIVPYKEDIEEYMAREVLPHIPDAQWFWEDDPNGKTPKNKIGAEIPFNKIFYKCQKLKSTSEIKDIIMNLDSETNQLMGELFG